MSVFEHSTRFRVLSPIQHPLKHTGAELVYAHPALPGVTSFENALNWLVAVLYPNQKASVATPADLPAVSNTLLDYRVVLDDGDTKAAAYRWEKREGDASAKWYKVYDMDWGEASILSHFQEVTQDLYLFKYGQDDRDSSGVAVSGLFAGQTVYGGSSASTNLTLRANSGDGVGSHTGYVQVDDNFRPTVNETWESGASSFRWKKTYALAANIASLTIAQGTGKVLVTSTDPTLDFAALNFVTTGNITGAIGYLTTRVEIGPLAGNALLLGPGSITDESGSISFDNEHLVTTGNITGAIGYLTTRIEVGPLVGNALLLAPGSIKDESGTINFDDENLTTTGNISGAIGYLATSAVIGPALGNKVTIAPGSISDGTGTITFGAVHLTTTGNIHGASFLTSRLTLVDNCIDCNTNMILAFSGAGELQVSASITPMGDPGRRDLGISGNGWDSLFLVTGISDSTHSFTIGELLSLRSSNYRDAGRTQPAQAGDTIFWSGSQWLASVPDTEILHSSISGLTTSDAGHTQFAMLAGRTGGQTIQGDTAASGNLVLESTAHATKGLVLIKDALGANTNASYGAGVWSGTDLGEASHKFRHVITTGEFKGLRAENLTAGTIPAPSAQSIGRLIYTTDTASLYVDTGSALVALSKRKYVGNVVSTGVEVTFTIDVSASVTDARLAIWQLCDTSANNFATIICAITKTDAATVVISLDTALDAGTYRLIGIE